MRTRVIAMNQDALKKENQNLKNELASLRRERYALELQLSSAKKLAKLGLWKWNLTNKRITFSDELYEIIGLEAVHFGGSIEDVIHELIHEDSRDFFQKSLQEDLAKRRFQVREFRINHPKKAVCWVRINGLVLDHDEGDDEVLGTVIDITEDILLRKELKDNLSFFESLMEAVPNPIFYKDTLGTYQFCNKAFSDYLGKPQDAIVDHTVFDIAPTALAATYRQADLDLMASKGTQVYETKVAYADGSLHDVIFNKATHMSAQGQVLGIVGIMQDITEKKTIEKHVQLLHQIKDTFIAINHDVFHFEDSEAFMHALLKKLTRLFPQCKQSTVLEMDKNGELFVLTSVNIQDKAIKDFRIPLNETFMWKDHPSDFKQAHIVNNILDFEANGVKKVVRSKDCKPIQSSLFVPVWFNGAIKWVFSFDSDQNFAYSEIERSTSEYIGDELPIAYRLFDLYRTTLKLSRYDSLTGFMSRSYFDEVFSDRLLNAQRDKVHLAVVLFDLDGLKRVNDAFGHNAGDLYLKTFAQFIQLSFRASDAFSRLGGDEFVGLFSKTTHLALEEKLTFLQTSFSKTQMQTGHQHFYGSFSYGIANFPDEGQTKDSLLSLADQRMYFNKKRATP